MIQNWVRLPRPKRDLETQTTYGPQFGIEDSQLSGEYILHVLSSSVSCEARTRGSGEVLCAKKHVFSCVFSEQK